MDLGNIVLGKDEINAGGLNIPILKGANGYTPAKGIDYWTDEDKQEIIEDVEGETNPIIEALQEEQTTQNNRIEELEEQIQELENNQLTGTATGQSIYIEDSANAKVRSIALTGNTTQESTTGKQLFDLKGFLTDRGVSYTENEDGSITFTPINSQTYMNPLQFSEEDIVVSLSGSIMNISSTNARVQLVKKDGSSASVISEEINTLNNRTANKIRFDWSTAGTITMKNIMLNEGTTAEPYEPYTGGIASPNPDYSQEIHRTGDNVNFFDKDNGEQGAIDATGNYVNNNTNWRSIDFIKVNPNTIYSFSIDRANITNNNKLRIYEYSQNKNFISPRKESIVNQDLTFTTGQNTEYIKYTIYIDNETMTSNIINSIKPKLELGSVVTPYSPYGCGNINEKVQNKNIVSLETSKEKVVDGLPFTVEDGIIKINGTNTSTNSFFFDSFKTNSGTAMFWVEISGYTDKDSGNASILLQQSDDNIKFSTLVEVQLKSNLNKTRQVTLDSNKYYRIRFYVNKNTFTNSEIKVQLEYGNQKTIFIPHAEQNISFPLAQGQVLAEGDYLADDGIHHKKWSEVLDGVNKKIDMLQKYNDVYFAGYSVEKKTVPSTNVIKPLCTHFQGIKNGTVTPGYCYTVASGIRMVLVPTDQTITTVQAFNEWLQEQYNNGTPVEIEYDLAEEVIDPYTEEQQAVWDQIKALRTYKPVTHISSTDEVPATVDVTYVKDLETVINSLGGA